MSFESFPLWLSNSLKTIQRFITAIIHTLRPWVLVRPNPLDGHDHDDFSKPKLGVARPTWTWKFPLKSELVRMIEPLSSLFIFVTVTSQASWGNTTSKTSKYVILEQNVTLVIAKQLIGPWGKNLEECATELSRDAKANCLTIHQQP